MEFCMVLLVSLHLVIAKGSAKAIDHPFGNLPDPHGYQDFESQRFGGRRISHISNDNRRMFDDFLAGTENGYYRFWCLKNPHLCMNHGQQNGWNPSFDGNNFNPNMKLHNRADPHFSRSSHPSAAPLAVQKEEFNVMETIQETEAPREEILPETTTTSPLVLPTSLATSSTFLGIQEKMTTNRQNESLGEESVQSNNETELGPERSSTTSSILSTTAFQDSTTVPVKDVDDFNFGAVPLDTPISTSDVNGFPAGLTSSGVPINPALTVLQDLENPKVGDGSVEATEEEEDSDEEGFSVDDPDDFLSSIKFRPVKFRPFQVLEIFDHPIQAYPRLAKPVRADSILSLLNNNFADVLRELQEREMMK